MDGFCAWAILDVGCVGHIENLWVVLVRAILVHGPFRYGLLTAIQPLTFYDDDVTADFLPLYFPCRTKAGAASRL